jgi:hypothetical protein
VQLPGGYLEAGEALEGGARREFLEDWVYAATTEPPGRAPTRLRRGTRSGPLTPVCRGELQLLLLLSAGAWLDRSIVNTS